MNNHKSIPAISTKQVQAASELLEAIAGNRGLLAGVPESERTRLLSVAGQISRPEARSRRQLVKAYERQRKAAKSEYAESVLNRTGIRKLRRRSVFTTPNAHFSRGLSNERHSHELRGYRLGDG
ncbi:MAG: hypothetical protein A2270_08975 [Elusimicrobia bacterium RIFOXYA12_FULL_51_18]|nr:MAG: hypothetical protein A2270_08975 [Elusimicrobia bacterium RIFOXYA12_FULL_51_18]OGS31652.1 MAG: hypothetical protein A2218_05915 [Elusimicrobia bacterium RIFOXYA2_FULL_53_38]